MKYDERQKRVLKETREHHFNNSKARNALGITKQAERIGSEIKLSIFVPKSVYVTETTLIIESKINDPDFELFH